ncbi:hypothetical protein BLA29_007812 [Euroglyphus maynei]|uniref:Elongator complex protein 5 n=1 Tax=Euroglyphus maynei TaxID=6958 RepID=A0A1Y3B8B8_EURMA|nr:hypothetical protein BLA29_007812 [Euroglyphus maynei]
MFDSSLEDSNESAVVYMSNVIIDFRLNNANNKQCSNVFVKNQSKKTIHCHVIAKKKHPRTHLRFDQKHEHIQIDENSMVKFIGHDNLMKQEKSEVDNIPQSSFRLTLSKEEEVARENLVLPYVKKNNSQPTIKSPETNIIYTYDKFDDFDDEDPDDDLDF